MRLDKKQLQKDIFVKGERVTKALIAPIIQLRIQEEQRRMIEEFESHAITQEINAGEQAENSSGTLGGYGNLFSFIGFNEGSDPIEPISNILRKRITFTIRRANDYGRFSVIMNVPEKSEVESVAKVEWLKGRSWLDGIEKGLAGLNRYLYDEDYHSSPNSLSGTGLQARNPIISGVTYKRTKYISQILGDFRQRLTRLF